MDITKLYPSESHDLDDPFDEIVQATQTLKIINPYYDEATVTDYADRGNLFVAHEADGLIKGAAIFEPLAHLEEPEAWLHNIAVLPEFRRQHIGTEMISFFSRYCLERGIKRINAYPTPDALTFYEKTGFTHNRVASRGFVASKYLVKR